MKKSLKEIGKQYKTDKVNDDVNYTEAYEKYFENIRDKSLKILEIGVKHGAGLLTWNNYFTNACIYGMDNWLKVSDYQDVKINMKKNNIVIFEGDQANPSDLEKLVNLYGPFDIIIDDGGHTMKQQQFTLGFMFKSLNNGGIYVIEDLATSHWGFANDKHKDFQSANNEQKITTLDYLKRLQNQSKSLSNFLTDEQSSYIEKYMDYCEVFPKTAKYESNGKFWDAGIGFIKKK